MVIRRGELYWLDLGQPRGSSPGYIRPAVIIQDNDFNQTRLSTVIVALLTTNIRLAKMTGNVLLTPRPGGLQKLSVVNVTQLYTVDKDDLTEFIGRVSRLEMEQIDRGLRRVLSLNTYI